MKTQLSQLDEMSETLESSGFSTQQSNAVIKSVALAMETFAVTPELLDNRLEKLKDEMLSRFKIQDGFIKVQGESIKVQGQDIKELKESMHGLEGRMHGFEDRMLRFEDRMLRLEGRMLRYMTIFTVVILTSILGGFGTLVALLI